MSRGTRRENGYSLVELLVATVLFTIIAGTVFSLLMSAQLRYRGESDVTTAFQQANVAIDQITRDVHSSGYPPASSFAPGVDPTLVALPFAWSTVSPTSYPNTPCIVWGSCGAVPGRYDLILEVDTGDGNGVQWIRYSLQGSTLMRGVTPKSNSNPVTSTSSALVPYLENVKNGEVPVFSYGFDKADPLQEPSAIREVNIALIVQSPEPDPQTRQFRTIKVTGQAVRINPSH